MFRSDDLAALERLFDSAHAVVSMREIAAGNNRPDVLALRHDIDENPRAFETAMNMARWENAHGYRSTYYVLHTAAYWDEQPFFRAGLEEIALAGHEIGIHVNAIAEALRNGGDPHDILYAALEELRSWGHAVTGAASHGDPLCHDALFVNYEQFLEGGIENYDHSRTLVFRGREVRLSQLPLRAFGLAYEAYHLDRGGYLSDTGGAWNQTLADAALTQGQLHVLQHPDWWVHALSPDHAEAAA